MDSCRRESLRFFYRRAIFYLFLLNFCGATIKFPFLITNLTFWFLMAHVLYFELDITIPHHHHNRKRVATVKYSSLHKLLVCVLHPLSFCGSYVIALLATLLIVVFNPDFIAQRAKQEGHSVAAAWIATAWIHWLPPIWSTIDLLLHRHHLSLRYELEILKFFFSSSSKRSRSVATTTQDEEQEEEEENDHLPQFDFSALITYHNAQSPHYRTNSPIADYTASPLSSSSSSSSRSSTTKVFGNSASTTGSASSDRAWDVVVHILKLLWILACVPIVFGAWLLAGFTPQKVYGTPHNNYYIGVPCMVAVHLIAVVVLLVCVDRRFNQPKDVFKGCEEELASGSRGGSAGSGSSSSSSHYRSNSNGCRSSSGGGGGGRKYSNGKPNEYEYHQYFANAAAAAAVINGGDTGFLPIER